MAAGFAFSLILLGLGWHLGKRARFIRRVDALHQGWDYLASAIVEDDATLSQFNADAAYWAKKVWPLIKEERSIEPRFEKRGPGYNAEYDSVMRELDVLWATLEAKAHRIAGLDLEEKKEEGDGQTDS